MEQATEHMIAPDYDPDGAISDPDPDTTPPVPLTDQVVDPDPYGWIAQAVADTGLNVSHVRPEPLPENYAEVWSHGLSGPERFPDAIAKVLPNGTLLVCPVRSDCPIKGYAPGFWTTFEHIGPAYRKPEPYRLVPEVRRDVVPEPVRSAPRPQIRPDEVLSQAAYATDDKLLKAAAEAVRPDIHDPAYRASRDNTWAARMAEEPVDPRAEQFVRTLTDPQRRTPPTFEQDADDTETLSQVGGGVARPKAGGVLADADSVDLTPRPDTDVPDEQKSSGRLRSLWRYLTDPEWEQD